MSQQSETDLSLARALTIASARVATVLAGESLAAETVEPLPAPLRAQVHDLVYGTLRRYGWGDCRLAQLMARPPVVARLRALLLTALYRLDTRPDLAHAVVHQAVEAAARARLDRYKPLINGVLRNALRRVAELDAAVGADEVATTLHPVWWFAQLRSAYPESWPAIVEADNGIPPMSLRVNRRRASRDGVRQAFAAAGIDTRPIGEWGLRLPQPMPVESLPGFAAGHWSVQDLGAQQAADLLEPQDGQRILDACAAPGGKTAHLAEKVDAELVALDVDPRRLARVADNLARLRLSAELAAADAGVPKQWWDGVAFDRILLDAPCSASGVVRRHPDAKWLRRPEDVAVFARQQRRLLEALWPLLAPGGKLLYATCSVFPAENGGQIGAFLHRHADALPLTPGEADDHGRQLLPGDEHDGFYYALLEKRR